MMSEGFFQKSRPVIIANLQTGKIKLLALASTWKKFSVFLSNHYHHMNKIMNKFDWSR